MIIFDSQTDPIPDLAELFIEILLGIPRQPEIESEAQ
jgi:hypothetical protein